MYERNVTHILYIIQGLFITFTILFILSMLLWTLKSITNFI